MLAPLVMDLADKGIPVKIVSLGHRSGAVIMVRTESPVSAFRQLTGKRIAIPSRFAVDFLFLRRMLAQENMRVEELEIVEMPPPDMPAALYANAVDAYCTGEPFGAAAQSAGYARPLRMTRDEWPKYICCVLTVREELIDENPAMVQDLVNHMLGAGTWLDQQPANREKAVQIAAGQQFFNQDPKIIRFVMENPTDRVTYGDLRMIRTEFEELMQLSMAAGTIKHPIAYEKYVDEQFARTRAAGHDSAMNDCQRWVAARWSLLVTGCSHGQRCSGRRAAGARARALEGRRVRVRRGRRRTSRCRARTAAS